MAAIFQGVNRHNVSISVNGAAVADWESYEINQSMRLPASTCALSGPLTAERLKAVPLGAEVQVHIDRKPIFSGYITSRQRRGHRLDVQCHDRVWRLVRDSAPFVRLPQETLASFAKIMAGDVFGSVTFSNAKNRNLYGRGARRVGSEPPVINGSDEPVKVSPGATRWQALAEILRRADLLAWSSGDGKELVLAKPNFAQEPRYEFRISDTKPGTCIDISVADSIEQSYRTVTVTGQSRVTPRSEDSYGDGLHRKGTATDPTYPLPLELRVVEEARSIQEATELAAAYLADAKSGESITTVQAFRHAQGDRFYAIEREAAQAAERDHLVAEERRLAVEREKLEVEKRKLAAEALWRLCDVLKDATYLGEDVKKSLAVAAAEEASGRSLAGFLPPADASFQWESPTQIAERLRVTVQRVGKAITTLGRICPTNTGWWRGRRSRDARVNEHPKVQQDKRT